MNRKGLISNYFKPSIYLRSFLDLNVTQLKRQGIKLLISDLDNTLVPHYKRLPNSDVLNFIKKVKDAGIHFAIMSNNVSSRVKLFAEKANVKVWAANAKKPMKRVAKKIIQNFDVNPSEVIIMGDQIIMDILVANRLKCESILVQPLVGSDYKMNAFNMFLEDRIYVRLQKNNILQKNTFSKSKIIDKNQII